MTKGQESYEHNSTIRRSLHPAVGHAGKCMAIALHNSCYLKISHIYHGQEKIRFFTTNFGSPLQGSLHQCTKFIHPSQKLHNLSN